MTHNDTCYDTSVNAEAERQARYEAEARLSDIEERRHEFYSGVKYLCGAVAVVTMPEIVGGVMTAIGLLKLGGVVIDALTD